MNLFFVLLIKLTQICRFFGDVWVMGVPQLVQLIYSVVIDYDVFSSYLITNKGSLILYHSLSTRRLANGDIRVPED